MSQDLSKVAEQRLGDLLAFFGINTEIVAEQDGESISLNVDTDDSGKLIGRRGENLAALQHIMNMMLKRETDERVYVQIDVGGYKKARGERAVAQAKTIAEKVLEDGVEAVLPPMTAGERRLVHMELREIDGIETESRGEGRDRRLVIRKTD